MPGGRRWNWRCTSVTGCTNPLDETLTALPGVAREAPREVERVAARDARFDLNDDGLEPVDRGEAGAHLRDQIVLGDQHKVLTAMLRQTVCQLPLVLGEATFQLPLDRVEGMRVHIVDQRGERFAIIGKERKPGMCRERRTNRRAKLAPAPQPRERIILCGQFDATSRQYIAAGEKG